MPGHKMSEQYYHVSTYRAQTSIGYLTKEDSP